ncbi:hypothetical protein ACFUJ0_00275 [Streptomyces sp. NPDC057242]|uniref:hypothetical protein n=1 Tax=unclassified Streptomyces TaxID=2593676 RepID=UPI00363AA2D3
MPATHGESPTPEALNDAIRHLHARAGEQGRPLTADEQRIYKVLVIAWDRATRNDQKLAA